MMTWVRALAITTVALGSAGAAEYVVAPTGDDSGPGSPARPFRTIQKAADVMKAGDVCRIRGGVYRETVTVKASGAKGKAVRFVAAAGQAVTISGTEQIVGAWSVHKGKIYKVKVAKVVGQVFVDGAMMVEARWPNQPLDKRWDQGTWRESAAGSEYGKMVDPELARTGVDWAGALGVLNVGSWQTFLRPVRNHTAGGTSFDYAKTMGTRHESKQTQRKRTWPGFDKYFLMGKLEALDSPGEWFYDRKGSMLYLWPRDGRNPTGRRVEGKVRHYGLVADRKNHVRLDGVRLFAATVMLSNCADCTIENCRLDYPTYCTPVTPLNAVPASAARKIVRLNMTFLGGQRTLAPTMIDGKRHVVRNCRIAFSEAPGLTVSGSEHTIENCLIHDVDWRGLGNGVTVNGAGVLMGSAKQCVFRRNTVHHVGASEGVVLPHGGGSICEYNYVHHAGFVQSDGGLIQCSGRRLAGTIIRYNWVHDHLAFRWGGTGIRGDDLTRDLLIHHNVAWRCREKGIMIKGDRNRAYNNTCINNDTLDLILWSSPTPFKEWSPGQHAHLLKTQNANSKAWNNYAPIVTGQMHHEVRRAKKITAPAGDLSHNLGSDGAALTDPRTLTFRKPEPPLVSPAGRDFRPKAGSPLVDGGRVIEGITHRVVGKAPDVGAYERGAADYWIPGYQAPQASMPVPPHEATVAADDLQLAWLGGYRAVSYDVYFGKAERAVADATKSSPPFKGNQTTSTLRPGTLEAGRTYYWRIDSVKPNITVKGAVWALRATRSP